MKGNSNHLILFGFIFVILISCKREGTYGMNHPNLPSQLISTSIDGNANQVKLRFNNERQLIQCISADGRETSFNYSGNRILSIHRKDSGKTNIRVQAEFIYSANELVQIASYISSTPFQIDIRHDKLTNMYSAATAEDTYQFQFDDANNLVFQNSAIMDRATIVNSNEVASPFATANIPIALSIYYSFYDKSPAFLFFNKKMIESVHYKDLGETRNYSLARNTGGLIEEVEVNDGKEIIEKISIRY